MVEIMMMSRKPAILALLDIKVFLNKGYDVIIFVHAITNNFFHLIEFILKMWSYTKVWSFLDFNKRSYHKDTFVRI